MRGLGNHNKTTPTGEYMYTGYIRESKAPVVSEIPDMQMIVCVCVGFEGSFGRGEVERNMAHWCPFAREPGILESMIVTNLGLYLMILQSGGGCSCQQCRLH